MGSHAIAEQPFGKGSAGTRPGFRVGIDHAQF